jgi:hypothetical protein
VLKAYQERIVKRQLELDRLESIWFVTAIEQKENKHTVKKSKGQCNIENTTKLTSDAICKNG